MALRAGCKIVRAPWQDISGYTVSCRTHFPGGEGGI